MGYRKVGTVYRKDPDPWGGIIIAVIVLIVIGAIIG